MPQPAARQRCTFPTATRLSPGLLVRNLIPDAIPGDHPTTSSLHELDYSRLDRAGAAVRIRLNSTVVRAVNSGDGVEVTYVHSGRTFTVRARNCVMACWNMMIPYLCPELPDAQKEALHQLVKTPLVYTSVALRNWEAFNKLKVSRVYAPAAIFPASR